MNEAGRSAPNSKLQRWQAISGLIFAIFALLHLSTHLFAPGGRELYAQVQGVMRLVYQTAIIEIVFALALVVHIACGVMSARRRKKSGRAKAPLPARARWHRRSGWFLAIFILGHILATRGLNLWKEVDVGFDALSFAYWWSPAYFYPYYAGLGLLGLYHVVHGSMVACGRLGLRWPRWATRGPGFWLPVCAFGLGLVLAFLAFDGRLFEIPDPRKNDYAEIYGDLVGVDLEAPR